MFKAGLSELFLVGGCVKKVGGCDELKTEREGGLHTRFLHLNQQRISDYLAAVYPVTTQFVSLLN